MNGLKISNSVMAVRVLRLAPERFRMRVERINRSKASVAEEAPQQMTNDASAPTVGLVATGFNFVKTMTLQLICFYCVQESRAAAESAGVVTVQRRLGHARHESLDVDTSSESDSCNKSLQQTSQWSDAQTVRFRRVTCGDTASDIVECASLQTVRAQLQLSLFCDSPSSF